jgi:hypothetical protein
MVGFSGYGWFLRIWLVSQDMVGFSRIVPDTIGMVFHRYRSLNKSIKAFDQSKEKITFLYKTRANG